MFAGLLGGDGLCNLLELLGGAQGNLAAVELARVCVGGSHGGPA